MKYYSFLKKNSRIRNLLLFIIRGPLFNMFNLSFIYILSKSFKRYNINNNYIEPSAESTKAHLDSAINWFTYNQDKQSDGGISSDIEFKFSRLNRAESYPEVTGYIITTLFNYSKLYNDTDVYKRAEMACMWELSLQYENGAFPGLTIIGRDSGPSVFNTAQIVDGLITAYKYTKKPEYLNACEKACDWMVLNQDNDGGWRRNTYKNIARTYDTKVAESILRTNKYIPKEKYLTSAINQIEFTLSNQKDNGWFYNCDNSLERNDEPLMHLIGYTVHGLLESYFLLNNEELKNRILESVKLTLEKLLHISEVNHSVLKGRYNSLWRPTVNSICVTGIAQIAISWFLIFKITNDTRFINMALKFNDFLKAIQYNNSNKNILGSIPQSYPLWGDYGPYKICSWGIKYFVDSLILEIEYNNNNRNIL